MKTNAMQHNEKPVIALCNFEDDQEGSLWQSTNDTVMGGLSTSSFSIEKMGDNANQQSVGVFSGIVTTENNGGFASISRPVLMPDLMDQQAFNTIQFKVVGDGKDYQIRTCTQSGGNTIRYKFEFTTSPSKCMTINAALGDFKATFRGREIRDAPPLHWKSINEIGFLISKGQIGDFTLKIQNIFIC